MKMCRNCFSEIKDLRKEVRCVSCNEPIHKDCVLKGDSILCDVCFTVKQEERQKPRLEFEMPEVIRRSHIETYKSCPYKFYMEVIKGIEQPDNIYTRLGIDLHELFDKASSDLSYRKHKMHEDHEELWKAYKDELFDSEEQKSNMFKRGKDSIETFYSVIEGMPEPYATEETIEFSVGEDLPLVSATSDRVNLINGELEMMDWKTGQVLVGQRLSSDLQAPLYIYSVREKYKMPVRKFTFYYLKDNKERVFERVEGENYVCRVGKREYKINLTDKIREVQHIFSQIKNGNFNIGRDTRSMYFTCKMCHIREKGMCEGAETQSWVQYAKEE